MATKPPSDAGDSVAAAKRAVVYRIGGYVVSFVVGSLSALSVRYLLLGKALQLNPDTFISLVFTIAIGAASLVLALLAINYGRVSERVMTERADRSIEIQMSLFEKSLDLQTRLFDKTMSTLESIGRSTGVTEQRMADIFSFFQNPDFMKRIAERAVEETSSELNRKSKEGVAETQTEAQLAERLTKNIVRELSNRIEGLERAVRSSAPPMQQISFGNASTSEEHGRTRDLAAEEQEKARRLAEVKRILELMRKAIEAIPEARILERDPLNHLWDFDLRYKGKRVAIDLRIAAPVAPLPETCYNSIKLVFSNPVDCLVFAFSATITEDVRQELERRIKLLPGKIRYISGWDETTLHNELLGVFESISADLPSPQETESRAQRRAG